MTDSDRAGQVSVRFWAAARAAAGQESMQVDAGSLAEVLAAVRAAHPGNKRLSDVIAMCSVLIGETPVTTADPSEVDVPPGSAVELLPPFAGG